MALLYIYMNEDEEKSAISKKTNVKSLIIIFTQCLEKEKLGFALTSM